MSRKNRRNTDPRTSHEGAGHLPPNDRDAVYRKHREHHPDGLADWQLERLMGGSMNGKWRKRRSDLTRDGLLCKTGEMRKNPNTGLYQDVYTLAPQPSAQPSARSPFDNDPEPKFL